MRVKKYPLVVPRQPTLHKAVIPSDAGYVGIPDKVLTTNMIISSPELSDVARQWRNLYDWHLMDLQIEVMPKPNYLPEWVTIQGTINPKSKPHTRPFAQYVFPSTEFVDKDYKIEGEFGVSISLGFNKLFSFLKMFDKEDLAKTNGEAKITFKYNPKVAKIVSGHSGTAMHWTFKKAKGESPAGGLNIKAVIIRRRDVSRMKIEFEVETEFDRTGLPFGLGNVLPPKAVGVTILDFLPSPL